MRRAASILVTLLVLAACQTAPATPAPATALAPQPAYAPLVVNDDFIGGPPPASSNGQKWDADQEHATSSETPARVDQASRDQGVGQRPDPFEEFQPVLGANFTPEHLPATAALFAVIGARVGASTGPAKQRYQRPRPFTADTSYWHCAPPLDDQIRTALGPNLSYPSGHSTLGYAWALVLTQLMPDQAQPLMERGFQYGRSRVICGAHWTSDVQAGRVLAGAVVAQMNGMDSFQAQLTAARAELRAAGFAH